MRFEYVDELNKEQWWGKEERDNHTEERTGTKASNWDGT